MFSRRLGAAKQPEQSNKDQPTESDMLSCPMGSTPQREALFRSKFGAVVRALVPPDGVEEDMFKGTHQHTARLAIADLAASLLTHAIEDADELDNSVWVALVDEIRDEMRATLLTGRRRASPNVAVDAPQVQLLSLQRFHHAGREDEQRAQLCIADNAPRCLLCRGAEIGRSPHLRHGARAVVPRCAGAPYCGKSCA
jgi:hypothetical protein